jgi:hypothetical protein
MDPALGKPLEKIVKLSYSKIFTMSMPFLEYDLHSCHVLILCTSADLFQKYTAFPSSCSSFSFCSIDSFFFAFLELISFCDMVP